MDRREKAVELKHNGNHYYPGQNLYFNPAAIPRTLVYALDVEEITGKRKVRKG